ncbi:MAG: MiaB/RimO family radical SAM methylthiotransferase, partial [Clostridia bacterium]|nr:MiaB/RimO family radical SAM methylthiotransferase [Clostridia bacterium]
SICESIEKNEKISYVSDIMKTHDFEDLEISHYNERTRAYIKIQEGCNQFCSYCIIPYARGPIRSRNMDEILAETKKLIDNGYTEIIYTGIHVASFGIDRGKAELADLLKQANRFDGLKRIRLSSIEPMTLNKEFIDSIKECDKLCPHFHLSLQSGCDQTLKRMNRKYTTAQYREIVDGIRMNFKDVAITTDIMTGFPGETDEEFSKTLEFVKEISFADAHIFQYSPRKGTPAAKRDDQISPEIKEKRSKELINICKKSQDTFISSFIGETMEVLFEQPAKNGYFEGKTSNYITVYVKTNENLQGLYKNVVIDSTKNGIAYGTII